MQLARLRKLVKQNDEVSNEGVEKTTETLKVNNNLGKLNPSVRSVHSVVEMAMAQPAASTSANESKIDCTKVVKLNSWEQVVSMVDENVDQALSYKSKYQYRYWWSRYDMFCSKFCRQKIPFNAATAAGFLTYLAEESEGLGGVDQARSALRHYHYLNYPELPCPTEGMRVSMVVKGIKRRFKKPVEKKKPLAPNDFQKLLGAVFVDQSLDETKLVNLRFAAQVSLLFCTFARYEESAALEVSHLAEDDGDLVVIFPKGKQYQFGEARESVMMNQPYLRYNPVEILKYYLGVIKSHGNAKWLFPALRCRGRKIVLLDYPVSYDCVLKQFKGFAMDAKVTGSPRDYGLHSFRRGGVTTAVNNGCDEHTVQKQMRVASTKTVSRYATLSRRRLKRANFALFK